MVTDGKQWKYLVFYDVDNPSEGDIRRIIDAMEAFLISYILYKTKHGIHLVTLTPLTIENYSLVFGLLQLEVPEYYAGQTIRLSRKQGETQELISYNLEYEVIPNLSNLYRKRFPQLPEFHNDGIWHLVFEKYWSKKV